MKEEKRIKLDIQGMHCAACSSRIERVVGKQDGITSIQVNLANESAEVILDEQISDFENIAEVIKGLGFAASIAEDPEKLFEKKKIKDAENLKNKRITLFLMMFFALPLFYVSMGEMVGLPIPQFIHPLSFPGRYALVQLLLVLPVMFFGRDFYINGLPALIKRSPNMDSLIAIGTGAAFIYSFWNTIEILMGHNAQMKVMDLYYESTGILLTLVFLGKFLEASSKSRMSGAIESLIDLKPQKANVVIGGETKEIDSADLKPGDVVLIKPGDRIPVDGCVVSGSSMVDESMLTGEAIPIDKQINDNVYSGTFNSNGTLQVKTVGVGHFTMLAKIIEMVQQAQGGKPPIANLADRISYYFVPTVIIIALLSGLAWYLFSDAGFSGSLKYFIAVMVIACPCAMGLATPTSIMVGTGRGAQLGVLIKNGAVLEEAGKIDVICFDKTGTLTHGRPKVTDLIILNKKYSEESILSYSASIESVSEHPLATAVVTHAEDNKVSYEHPENFESVSGKGVKASINSLNILIGNEEFIKDHNIDPVNEKDQISLLLLAGKTVLYMAIEGKLVALIAVADTMREEAPEVIQQLNELGVHSVILTGDNEVTANYIAKKVGVGKLIARLLPSEKAEKIKRLQKNGHIVAMVGDGINDAPALATANAGIAMGTGIDVAIETGDIVLVKGRLAEIVTSIKLSRQVMKNIKQNLFWAFAFNSIGIPVAAGFLVVFGGPGLNPMLAGAAMAMSSVMVVSNALRLRYFTP